MRVLMFGWEFPPYNSGGLGVACYGLSRALINEGQEVTFVLPRRVPIAMNGMRFVFADSGKAIDASVAKQLMNAYAPSSMALSLLMRDRLPMGWGLFD